MFKQERTLDLVKEFLPSARRRGERLRTIYLRLRKQDKFWGMSDLALLSSITEAMADLNLPYKRKEVYSAFKEVDKEDYDQDLKRLIIQNLTKKATKD